MPLTKELVDENFEMNLMKNYPKSNLCRFCFCIKHKSEDYEHQLNPITLDLLQSVKILTNIQLSLDIELPSMACQSCLNAIALAVQTQDLVTKSEKKLLKFHNEMKSKITHGEIDQLTAITGEDFNTSPDIEIQMESLEEIDMAQYIEEDNFVSDCNTRSLVNERPKPQDLKRLNSTSKSQNFTEQDGYVIFKNSDNKLEYWCTKCNHKYNKKVSLDYHFQHAAAHNPGYDNSFICPECGACFYDDINVKRHRKQVHDTLKTPCEYCKRELNAFYMKIHLKKHLGTKRNHKCKICSKIFNANFLLQNHIRKIHTGEKPFNCLHCKAVFSTKRELSKHFAFNHPDEITNFLCNNCGCRCMSKQGLAAHEKVCIQKEVADLRKNLNDTTTQKPKTSFALPLDMFSCQYCNKKYADQNKLQEHETRHLNSELNYQCKECNLFFSRKDGLTTHVLGVHTKEFKHFCKFCERGFISNAAKVSHERSHTKERPYVCSVKDCGKSFFRSHALKQHIEAAHRNQRYRCKFCLKIGEIKELRKLVSIVKHVQTVHAERSQKGDVDYSEMLIEDVIIEPKVNNTVEEVLEIEVKSPSEI